MSGELKNSVKHQMYEVGKSWLEWATGPMKSSKVDKGMITPEEFVMAGDALVTKCPSWTWASAPSDKRVAYLPKNKQYIVIKRVPCMARARAPEAIKETNIDVEGEDWTLPETVGPTKGAIEDVADIDGPTGGGGGGAGPEDIEDIESVDGDATAKKPTAPAAAAVDDVEEIDDPTAPPAAPAADAAGAGSGAKPSDASSNPFSPRTYDVSITYDQTYATPRIWLMGYGASGAPLTESETCEDIWGDYSGETVTLLPHPFLGTPHVSVHPCKHAESMERMLRELNVNLKERWDSEKGAAKGEGAAPGESGVKAEAAAKLAGGGGDGPPKLGVEAYMFVFLKFMTCVVPTISYDNTRDLDF